MLARLSSVHDQLIDHRRRRARVLEEDRAQSPKCPENVGHRCGHQDRAKGSAEDDHGSGSLRHILDAAFFHDQAADDSGHGQQDAGDGGDVGPQSAGLRRGGFRGRRCEFRW